jgi:UDP-glucose 4-epimerase
MRALITGGAGFIGGHLCEVLINRGWQIQILDDLSTGCRRNFEHLIDNPAFEYAIDSVLNELVLDRLVSECDVIFHLAAAVGVELIVKKPVHTIRTNVEGTDTVLKVAKRYHKSILIASTSEVYGKSTKIPFREDDDTVSGPTTKHRWAYACSKAIDEFAAFAMAKETGQPVYVARLFNTVGARQTGRYGMVVPRFVKQALNGEPITVYGDGKQSRCFCNVTDVVQGLADLVLCEEARGEVVKSIFKSASPIVHIPYDDAYEEGFEDMCRRVPCLEKAQRLLNYNPTIPLDQTINEVGEYLKNQKSEE